MDAFEHIVSELLWMEGLWVRRSVKLELNANEKRRFGSASAPRPEIDVLAYSGRDNLLRVVECKSYLNSRGVTFDGVTGADPKAASRYKLFWDERRREVVFEKLIHQLVEAGTCPADVKLRLCLACGNIASERDRSKLRSHFANMGWELWDESWLRERLLKLAKSSYDNEVLAIAAKLIVG